MIYYWILLILHTINRNYEELFIQIRKIDYTNILDKNTILFFIEILNEKRRTIYGKLYSQKTHMLLLILNSVWLNILCLGL